LEGRKEGVLAAVLLAHSLPKSFQDMVVFPQPLEFPLIIHNLSISVGQHRSLYDDKSVIIKYNKGEQMPLPFGKRGLCEEKKK